MRSHRTTLIVEPGEKVIAAGGVEGRTTGATHRCQMEGCTGTRITTKWPDGRVTHPCSKGMDYEDSAFEGKGVWRILP